MEYLGKGSKRDLNSEETKKLGKPEGQFEKIRIERQPEGATHQCAGSQLTISIHESTVV